MALKANAKRYQCCGYYRYGKTVNSSGDNKAAIDKNTKAIDALKGQVGTTIKNNRNYN